MFFYGEGLLAPRPTPKLVFHPSSTVRGCLFNLFTATLHIGGRSSIRNPRNRHAVVTGPHIHGHKYVHTYSAKINWGLSHKALQTIYVVGILPLLLYGAPVWIGAMEKDKYKNKLKRVQSLTLILRRSCTGTVWVYTSTSNKRGARPKLYTKSLTRDLKRMYSRLTLVRISINL